MRRFWKASFNNWLTRLTFFGTAGRQSPLDRDIVDQPGAADMRRRQQPARPASVGCRRKRFGIDERDIVNPVKPCRQQHRLCCRTRDLRRRALGNVARGIPQRAWKRHRTGAIFGHQIGVARRQRQAVIITLGWHADNLDFQIKVEHQTPDDGKLLKIFLAKQRGIGPHLVEQLGDNRRDAVEMARPCYPVQPLANAGHRNIGCKPGRIHLVGAGRPQNGAAGFRQQPGVRCLASRVAREIFACPKLARVDENGCHDMVRHQLCCLDQRDMPGVQRAHGGHQRDARAACAQGKQYAAKLNKMTDGLHADTAFDMDGRAFYGRWLQRSTREARGLSNGPAKTHVIVFANEKGGTGKSTTAVHVAIALAAKGARVACYDLDHRQRTMGRYLDNRAATIKRLGRELPMPQYATHDGESLPHFTAQLDTLTEVTDFLIVDTPGRDDRFARMAVQRADTLVTPMNDSFVDFDLIGQVDPVNFKVTRPSFYSELIWDARKARAKADGSTIDWVVLRNRLQHIEARNMRRVSDALFQLSKRVGFRVAPGLGERVIYRELFPNGLTMIDSRDFGEMGLGHVAARQELRDMMTGLALPEPVLPLFA